MPTAPTRAERALATRRRMVRAAYELFCRERVPGYDDQRGGRCGRRRGADRVLHLRHEGRPAQRVSGRGHRRVRPVAGTATGADRHGRAAGLARMVGRLRGGPDGGAGARPLRHPRRRDPQAGRPAGRGVARRLRRPRGGRGGARQRGAPGGLVPHHGSRHRPQARRVASRSQPRPPPPTSSSRSSAPSCTRRSRSGEVGHRPAAPRSSGRSWQRNSSIPHPERVRAAWPILPVAWPSRPCPDRRGRSTLRFWCGAGRARRVRRKGTA